MKYTEILPHPSLKPFILNYWIFQVPATNETAMQEIHHVAPADACVSLLFVMNPVMSEPGILFD